MAAVIFDVVADQNRDFNLHFKMFDYNDEPRDWTNYGAVAEVRTLKDGTLVARATHSDTVTLFIATGREGEVHMNFPHTAMNVDADKLECEYECIVHPIATNPEDKPESIIRGLFTFRPKTANLIP